MATSPTSALDAQKLLGDSTCSREVAGRLAHLAQAGTPDADLRAVALVWACSREPAADELLDLLGRDTAAGRAEELVRGWSEALVEDAVRGLVWDAESLRYCLERISFSSACEHGTWLAEQRAELQACLDLLEATHDQDLILWQLRSALETIDHLAERGWELRYAVSVLEPGPVASSAAIMEHDGWWVAFAGE